MLLEGEYTFDTRVIFFSDWTQFFTVSEH